MFVFVWPSLNILPSRFIHVVAKAGFCSSLRRNNVSVRACVYMRAYSHIFFLIYKSNDTSISQGCFPILTIVSNAATNVGLQISIQDTDFNSREYIPRGRIAGSRGGSVFNYLSNHQTIFHSGSTKLHSHQQCISHKLQIQGPWAESGPPPCFIRPGSLLLPRGSAKLSLNC